MRALVISGLVEVIRQFSVEVLCIEFGARRLGGIQTNDARSVPKTIKTEAVCVCVCVLKCTKSDSKESLGRFRWPLGRRLLLGVLWVGPWGCPAISFSHVAHLFEFGCHFGAHWILKGVPKVVFLQD